MHPHSLERNNFLYKITNDFQLERLDIGDGSDDARAYMLNPNHYSHKLNPGEHVVYISGTGNPESFTVTGGSLSLTAN